jgi:hypothetical protein
LRNLNRAGAAIVASLALSLGAGAAYAAPIDSVTDSGASRQAALPADSVTSTQVKNGSLYQSDVAPSVNAAWLGTYNNTVDWSAFKPRVLTYIQTLRADVDALKNAPGAVEPAPAWGEVLRNVKGNGRATLATVSTHPPMGNGALVLHTGGPTDKAAFGNEIDYNTAESWTPNDFTKLGYSVYTTGENADLAPNNMPSIAIEIDPNLDAFPAKNYSTLVFAPNNSTANAWTAINALDDAQGKVWGLTGLPGTTCDINGARCTWTEMKAYLNDGNEPARMKTLQVTKGSDFQFHGAVDKLQFRAETFDFEQAGTFVTAD